MAKIRGNKKRSAMRGFNPYDNGDDVTMSIFNGCCCPPNCWTRSWKCCPKPIGQRPWDTY